MTGNERCSTFELLAGKQNTSVSYRKSYFTKCFINHGKNINSHWILEILSFDFL